MFETKSDKSKMFVGIYVITSIIVVAAFVGYITMITKSVTVLIAKDFIQVGSTFTKEDMDKYLSSMTVSYKMAKEMKYIEDTEEGRAFFTDKRAKYNRIKGDFITKELVEIDQYKDPIKYKIYKLSQDYGKVIVAKSVKLNPDEQFVASDNIGKNEDIIKIKFIADINGKKIISERYSFVPILDFTKQGGKVINISIAMTEDDSNAFDLERSENKKMVVEFLPFSYATLIKAYGQHGRKVVTKDEIDAEYLKGISHNVLSGETVSSNINQILDKTTSPEAVQVNPEIMKVIQKER